MEQYNILFESSKIEYITPFLKLWMSFNNWYKKEFQWITSDANAIRECKKEWNFKQSFMNLLWWRSGVSNEFNNALSSFYENLQNYDLKDKDWNIIQINHVMEWKDWRSRQDINYFKEGGRWQYFESEKDVLFEEFTDAIYQVRCNLVHWNFDLDNQYFIWLIKDSYNILYPILNNIFENQLSSSSIYECTNSARNVDAKCEYRDWKFIVLFWSHVAKTVAQSFSQENIEKRNQLLNWKYDDKWDYLEMTESIEFDSPSWASNFCLWVNSNWRNEWKRKDWKTLSDILRNN